MCFDSRTIFKGISDTKSLCSWLEAFVKQNVFGKTYLNFKKSGTDYLYRKNFFCHIIYFGNHNNEE